MCQQGCNGGYVAVAYEWELAHGITTSACFPGSTSSSCPSTCSSGATIPRYYPNTYYQLDYTDFNAIRQEIFDHGTLAGSIEIYSDFEPFFRASPTGVYHRTTGKYEGNHAVKIMGYGTSASGEPYLLCQNSWGAAWGDGGFFRLLADPSLGSVLYSISAIGTRPEDDVITFLDPQPGTHWQSGTRAWDIQWNWPRSIRSPALTMHRPDGSMYQLIAVTLPIPARISSTTFSVPAALPAGYGYYFVMNATHAVAGGAQAPISAVSPLFSIEAAGASFRGILSLTSPAPSSTWVLGTPLSMAWVYAGPQATVAPPTHLALWLAPSGDAWRLAGAPADNATAAQTLLAATLAHGWYMAAVTADNPPSVAYSQQFAVTAVDCTRVTSCGTCIGTETCGWCNTLGTCLEGSSTADAQARCPSSAWLWQESTTCDGIALSPPSFFMRALALVL